MVIPIGGSGMGVPAGPPPPEVHGSLRKLKISTVILMLFCLGRMVSSSIIGWLKYDIPASLNIIINLIFGAFLLKDDPCISRMFQRCQQLPGGMVCLMPYGISCFVFAILDLAQNWEVIQDIIGAPDADLTVYSYAFTTMGSIIAEFVIVYFCFVIFKTLRSMAPDDANAGARGMGAPLRSQALQEVQAREVRPGFVPFQDGRGQRLGG
eukprot:gnl/MRDRNA2_/MRDRNA2_55156_c0_seq2.p1 gnl/MRDRNA2_/MRDRNA2_55156_c0~~gnl/MRDRNA2_/MRDRNA2_55156_c0_seq2.p1  ORF type:complete len:209 (-),score=36.62 gnl/MRDRNA2_/MRDRNA2_55156_c0_seq2:77-703(-)